MIPIVRGVSEITWESGEDWLRGQPEEVQIKTLGPGAHEMWKNGDIELKDLVNKVEHPIWGPSLQRNTLASLRGDGGLLPPSKPTPIFETVKEAEAWAKANIAPSVSYSVGGRSIGIDEINSINMELDLLTKKYGDLGLSGIKAVGTNANFAGRMNGATNILELRVDQTNDGWKRSVLSGINKMKPGIEGMIDHEIGHRLTPAIFDINTPGTPMTDFGKRLDVFFKANKERIRIDLTEYAASARHELIAEAFAAREANVLPLWIEKFLIEEGI